MEHGQRQGRHLQGVSLQRLQRGKRRNPQDVGGGVSGDGGRPLVRPENGMK